MSGINVKPVKTLLSHKALSRFKVLLALAVFIFAQGTAVMSAVGLSPAQRQLFNENINYFDIDACGTPTTTTTPTAGSVAPGPIYIMGDSITALAKDTYEKKFAAKDGWQTTVEGLRGRQIVGGAGANLPDGVHQLEQDKDKLRNANAIVIALGTNSYNQPDNKDRVQKAMAVIKANKKDGAPVYWVNTMVSFDGYGRISAQQAQALSRATNKAIEEGVGSDATVIDWYNEAKDKADWHHFGEGVHPYDQKDKNVLVNLVYETVTGSGGPSTTGGTTSTGTQPTLTVPAEFTLKDKIGQLLFVGVTDNSMAASLEKKYNIGGFLLNTGATYEKGAIESIKTAGKLPPLMAVDEEGGQVQRLKDAIGSYPSAKELGKLSTRAVKEKAVDMGKKMSGLGFDVNFAPVLDLDNGKNTAVSTSDRSFSSSPETVESKAGAFAEGLAEANVIPTFKHFPGLGYATGSTGGNTDTGPATSPSLADLEGKDLKPYKPLLKATPKSMVMMGNQKVPDLTGGEPATMSKAAYALLRDKYGFDGVIVTDDLGAASLGSRGIAQAVVEAIKSGADMPLFNGTSEEQVAGVINAVTEAVHNDTITKSQVDSSVSRVMKLRNSGQTRTTTSVTCACQNVSATALAGSGHVEQAFNYFVQQHGLTPFQAAAIVGTIMEESGHELDASITNSIGAHGIAQWTNPPYSNRRPALQAFAAAKSTDENDFATQLDFMWEELTHGYKATLAKLKTETNIDDAVYNFEATYEVSRHMLIPQRQANARKLLQDAGSVSSGSVITASSSASSSTGCGTTGVAGVGGYKNPYRDLQQKTPLRIDMGLDYAGKGPIYALGNGTVNVVYGRNGGSGWPGWGVNGGGGWVSYTLSDGPAAGKTVFFAENCVPTVKVGDKVTADTKICDLDGLTSAWSESGWAADKTSTSAAAHVEWRGHDSSAYYTAYGENFSQLIEKLGEKGGTKQAGAQKIGTIPDDWPRW